MTAGQRHVCVVSASPESEAGGRGRDRGSGRGSAVVHRSIDDAAAAIGWRDAIDEGARPLIAQGLRARGDYDAVCMLPFDHAPPRAWLESAHASGWIAPGLGNTFPDIGPLSTTIGEALDHGFVAADAVLLGFARNGLPRLSYGMEPAFTDAGASEAERPIDIYAIVDSSAALRRAVDAGIGTVQLRIKRPQSADSEWDAMLRREIEASILATRAGGAELVLNDHWMLAAELGIASVHLGQEDLIALGSQRRAALAASRVRLGISSHSVWELCRARSLATRYIACGPVWPTTTKDMPWIPQGTDNLAWWCAHAGRPVVAIGGILDPDQARIAGRSGADGCCLVRALGDNPARVVPAFRDAFATGRAERDASRAPAWPHPTLPSDVAE